MRLFKRYIIREVDELDLQDVRVRFLGEREGLPTDLQRVMTQMEDRTAGNRRLTVQVALNYGARREIVRATQHLAAEVAAGRLDADAIDENAISDALDTGGIADRIW